MWTSRPSGSRRGPRLILVLLLMLLLAVACCSGAKPAAAASCPPADAMPGCPCYNFADGLFLECTKPTEESLKGALARVLGQARPAGECPAPALIGHP